eukprot:c29056_g1_i4 orf=427-4065(-)
MDRRSWLWKKKSSEKFAAAADSTEPSQTFLFEQCDGQGTEDRAKTLNGQLSTVLSELAAKEDLVRQHAKVAEEAVTGWEKAESETATLKQKLDAALQQRLAAEDRLLHLDGALKECMRQLRYVREEQEQRIHDMVMKKTKEWEKACAELEAKLAYVGSQLLEANAANNAMSKSLQECTQTIIEVNDAKSHSDAEVKILQVRLDAVEKESAKLKYESHVLSKELEIRNEEREYNKRAGDIANKQHLENVKRIAKLETECQRLRLLVRKRLPGPAAVAQMKLEVEALGKENGDRNRGKSPGRRNASVNSFPGGSATEIVHEFDIRQSEVLSDRVVAMEEETKLLKQVLAKRNSELEDSRLMCARTANKLSRVEEQIERLFRRHGLPKSVCAVLEGHMESICALNLGASKEPNLALTSEDGIPEDEISCAESWASALVAELAHFKKEKATVFADKMIYSNLELMDDFAEMEKLASENHTDLAGESERIVEVVGGGGQDTVDRAKLLELDFAMNDIDIESTTQLCRELRNKLSHAEEQLNLLHHKESASEATIVHLKQHLLTILKADTDGTNLVKVLEEVRDSMEAMKDLGAKAGISPATQVSGTFCLDIGTPDGSNAGNWSSSSLSEDNNSRDRAVFTLAAKTTVFAVGPELASAVHNVLCLLEGLAQSDYSLAFPHLAPHNMSKTNIIVENGDDHGHMDPRKDWKNLDLDGSIRSLVALCQSFLQGKMGIIEFMVEVASVLDWLVGYAFLIRDKSTVRSCIRRQLDWGKGLPIASDFDVVSTANRLALQSCKVLDLEGVNEAPDQNLVSEICVGASTQDGELQSILLEKESIAAKLEYEARRVVNIEGEIAQLRKEKSEIECDYKLAIEKLEHLKQQLAASEYKVAELQSKLAATCEENQSLENNLTSLRHANERLEEDLKNAKSELKQIEGKAVAIQEELKEEIKYRKDAESQLDHLQQLKFVKGSNATMGENDLTTLVISANDQARLQKQEQEIALAAEKLAECQQTILVLGKQLKALGTPKDVMGGSLTSSVGTGSMHRQGVYSGQDYNASESIDTLCNSCLEGPCASPGGYGRQWNESRMRDNVNHSGPRSSYGAGSVETEPDATVHRVQNARRSVDVPTYGRQVPLEGSSPLSPIYGDCNEDLGFNPCSPSEPALSYPVRSPARFLSLKSRGSGGHDSFKNANGGESVSSSEKHVTGFSRFFHRTRSGH